MKKVLVFYFFVVVFSLFYIEVVLAEENLTLIENSSLIITLTSWPSSFRWETKCFPANPGNYAYLEKHAWVLTTYTMIRDLKLEYSLIGKENEIREFVIDFHSKVYREDFRQSNVNYDRFYNNVP